MIKYVSTWDETFFKEFVQVRNDIYFGNKYFIPDTLTSFKEMLSLDAPFNLNNSWQAWLIYDSKNNPVARVFASTRKDGSAFKQTRFLPIGYFESNNYFNASLLLKACEDWAKDQGYTTIRGPIQGNVFNSSRFTSYQKRKPFYGEPIHKKEYIDYFKESGFSISQNWISAHYGILARIKGMYNYLSRFSKSKSRKQNYKIRTVDFNKWEEEFKLLYNLLMDSYSQMDDVELITYDEFRVWSEGIKAIVEKKNCLILENEGEPLGFIIAYNDLLPQIAALYRKENLINKVRFILAKKIFKGPLLINYLGKKNESEGIVKGVSPKIFSKLAKNNNGFLFQGVYLGFISENSKTMEIVPKIYDTSTKYIMFEKTVS
jgi:hypothetical protein